MSIEPWPFITMPLPGGVPANIPCPPIHSQAWELDVLSRRVAALEVEVKRLKRHRHHKKVTHQ